DPERPALRRATQTRDHPPAGRRGQGPRRRL
ncbi:MAG: hypothetical protein AVDCRST_MAG65-1468, partial [uncultured Solirubrobacteraceae bacterium]